MGKHTDVVQSFFKDRDGHWAIIAFPNALLLAWLASVILTKFIQDGKAHDGLSLLGSATLFAWAYLELTEGVSSFRRVVGAIILLTVSVGYFVP